MSSTLLVDLDAVTALCRARGVRRMRRFGSATVDRFDDERSDVDVLVEFESGLGDPFATYFGLKEDLESLFGRPVDLVMADAAPNPYFHASAIATSEELMQPEAAASQSLRPCQHQAVSEC